MRVTPELLTAAVGCSPDRARLFAPLLEQACATYQINTPARFAAFIAQIGHESGSLRWLKEIWGPTPVQLRYEGRADLGNTQPGDGSKFRGRGLIQTTGRSNYARLRDRLQARGVDCPDFEERPEALEEPAWAVLSAADYWDMRGLNTVADVASFETITKRINGGFNGLEHRKKLWEQAKAALSNTEEKPVTPIIAGAATVAKSAFFGAAVEALTKAIPELIDLFKGESPTAQRNAEAGKLLVGIAKEAVQAGNEQDLVEALENPAAVEKVREAVKTHWYELTEVGGGPAAARAADLAMIAATRGDPWYAAPLRSTAFWAAMLLLPMAYMVAGSIAGLWGYSEWSSDVRSSLATAVISLVIGSIAGYYFGFTSSANRAATK